MRIEAGALTMESSRAYKSVATRSFGVTRKYALKGEPDFAGGLGGMFDNLWGTSGSEAEHGNKEGVTTGIEDIAAHLRSITDVGKVTEEREKEDPVRTIKQQCIRFLVDVLFRVRGEQYVKNKLGFSQAELEKLGIAQPNLGTRITTYTSKHFFQEEETTTFSTTGLVKTADGRELSFQLEFGMSRSFQAYYEEAYSMEEITYMDPLVINLDTNVAQVSDQKFLFDLDSDGTKEEISQLKSGSGFLALDLNGDGVISDGSELFGTKSGNGFRDLAKYDADKNGWIDEGDPIWEKLLVWTKDEEGNDSLQHLSELGIGAISLSNISTQYALNSETDNHNNAMIRNTGIFLYENGNVSTVQHLDLAR